MYVICCREIRCKNLFSQNLFCNAHKWTNATNRRQAVVNIIASSAGAPHNSRCLPATTSVYPSNMSHHQHVLSEAAALRLINGLESAGNATMPLGAQPAQSAAAEAICSSQIVASAHGTPTASTAALEISSARQRMLRSHLQESLHSANESGNSCRICRWNRNDMEIIKCPCNCKGSVVSVVPLDLLLPLTRAPVRGNAPPPYADHQFPALIALLGRKDIHSNWRPWAMADCLFGLAAFRSYPCRATST